MDPIKGLGWMPMDSIQGLGMMVLDALIILGGNPVGPIMGVVGSMSYSGTMGNPLLVLRGIPRESHSHTGRDPSVFRTGAGRDPRDPDSLKTCQQG